MQKQKIKNNFLILQSTYSEIEIGLFNQDEVLEKVSIDKKLSSKNLIPDLETLLKKNELEIDDISFIGVNQGPGPFTILRVVIATANALNFAIKAPLIGINGIEAFLDENKSEKYPLTIALFNAYNNDVYFGISENNKITEIGWQNINTFLNKFKEKFQNQKPRLIGNGVSLFELNINEILKNNFYIPDPVPINCSIEQLAKIAYSKWLAKQDISQQITPLYLKDAIIKKEV